MAPDFSADIPTRARAGVTEPHLGDRKIESHSGKVVSSTSGCLKRPHVTGWVDVAKGRCAHRARIEIRNEPALAGVGHCGLDYCSD